MVDHKDGEYHAEILRVWKSHDGGYRLSSEFQEDCQGEDEYMLEQFFNAMSRFIEVENL